MASSFPCPHCQTPLSSAGEGDFQVICPTCNVAVSPPWVPTLALDEAAEVPVASAVEQAVPALVPVAGTAPSATADTPDEPLDVIPVLEEAPEAPVDLVPPAVKRPVDWTAFVPPEAPATQLTPGWRSIPFALTLVSVGSGILLVALLFAMVLGAVASTQGLQRTPDGSLVIAMGTHYGTTMRVEVLIVALGLALLAGGMFVVVGKLICCFVPRESNGRALAVYSALCLLMGLLMQFAAGAVNLGLIAPWSFVIELRDQYPDAVAAVAAHGILAGLAFHAVEIILFLVFLRSIGLFLADKRLPPSVLRYFKFTIFGPIVPALVLGAAYLLTQAGQAAFSPREQAFLVQGTLALVPITMFAYIMVLGLWYVVLVRWARDLVLRARMGRL
jgi:hypothetical protein